MVHFVSGHLFVFIQMNRHVFQIDVF